MESHPIRWCAITLFSLTVFSLSGCAASQKVLQQSFLLAWLPERGDDPADVAHFGPLPSQEIEQLHELSEQAADSDPAVQRRLAGNDNARRRLLGLFYQTADWKRLRCHRRGALLGQRL